MPAPLHAQVSPGVWGSKTIILLFFEENLCAPPGSHQIPMWGDYGSHTTRTEDEAPSFCVLYSRQYLSLNLLRRAVGKRIPLADPAAHRA